jgi:hypothetical protein
MKLSQMQKKYLLRAAMILLLIAGSYLILWSASKNQAQKETCKEGLEECCKKKSGKETSGETMWETFSHQFISTSTGF